MLSLLTAWAFSTFRLVRILHRKCPPPRDPSWVMGKKCLEVPSVIPERHFLVASEDRRLDISLWGLLWPVPLPC